MSKSTNLLAFARTSGRGAVEPEHYRIDEAAGAAALSLAAEAKKKNCVATNLRLTRDQLRRVQELAIRGLSRLFKE